MPIIIDRVDESVFPRDIAKAVNKLIDVAQQPYEVGLLESNDMRAARFERSNDKTKLLVARGGVGGTNAFDGQWQVQVRNFSGTWRFIVFKGSYLFSETSNNSLVVSGLASAYVPATSDPGWKTFSLGGSFPVVRVWIECELNTDPDVWPGTPTCSIQYDGGGNTWDGGDVEYVMTGTGDSAVPIESVSRKIIAVIYDRTGAGDIVVNQMVSSAQYLMYSAGTGLDDSGTTPKMVPTYNPY